MLSRCCCRGCVGGYSLAAAAPRTFLPPPPPPPAASRLGGRVAWPAGVGQSAPSLSREKEECAQPGRCLLLISAKKRETFKFGSGGGSSSSSSSSFLHSRCRCLTSDSPPTRRASFSQQTLAPPVAPPPPPTLLNLPGGGEESPVPSTLPSSLRLASFFPRISSSPPIFSPLRVGGKREEGSGRRDSSNPPPPHPKTVWKYENCATSFFHSPPPSLPLRRRMLKLR